MSSRISNLKFRIFTIFTIFTIFQLQCDWAQIQVIVLTNDGNGFGFGISGSRNSGAVVRNIFPGGAADRVRHFRFLNEFFFLQTLRNVTTRAGRQFTRRNQLIALDLCCQKVKTQVNI